MDLSFSISYSKANAQFIAAVGFTFKLLAILLNSQETYHREMTSCVTSFESIFVDMDASEFSVQVEGYTKNLKKLCIKIWSQKCLFT